KCRFQRGILAQDRALQLLQWRTRLDSELLDERLSRLLVHGEGFCLPAGAVESKHQLSPQPLAQRVKRDQPLELRNELVAAAALEIGLDPPLVGDESQLLEPSCLLLGKRLVREVGERGTAPERER